MYEWPKPSRTSTQGLYRFDTLNEVYISKQGHNIIISAKKPTWDEFFDSKSSFDDDFLKDRDDTPPQWNEISINVYARPSLCVFPF